MSNSLARFIGSTALVLSLILGGCAPTAQVQRPDTAPGSTVRSVALGVFSGPYAAEVRQALAEALNQRAYVTLDDQAAAVLSGKVDGSLEEINGEELVRMEKETGVVKDLTVEDPFVKKPFTYRVPEKETVVESRPFVVRRASLDVEYTLTARTGTSGVSRNQDQAGSEVKYGGVNEDFKFGPALKDLPSAEETIRKLSEKLAQKVLDRLFPDPRQVVVLDDGLGLLGETEIQKGVTLAQNGAWEEARQVWENILKNDPEHPAANYNLGVYWERLGGTAHLERARGYYVNAAKNGNDPHYREALTRITVALRDKTGQKSQ